MLIRTAKHDYPLNTQSGRVTVFGVVMVIIIIITGVMLFMLASEVLKKEKIMLTVGVTDSDGYPVVRAHIYIDDKHIGDTDLDGVLKREYRRGERLRLTAKMTDYLDSETKLSHGIPSETIELVLERPFVSLTVVAKDSVSGMPVHGVDVFLREKKLDVTDSAGTFTFPPDSLRLYEVAFIKLEKKGYRPISIDVWITSEDYSETIRMSKSKARVSRPPRRKRTVVDARTFLKKIKIIKPPAEPSEPDADTATILSASVEEDSAFLYMSDSSYRRALDIYLDLTSQRMWSTRGDFWLYSADCALHLAADPLGRFKETVLDSALQFLEKARRYENLIQGDLFPAVIQIKMGEAYAYKSEIHLNRNIAKCTEYRNKALFNLRGGISFLRKKQLKDHEFFKFAIRLRDEVLAY